MALTCSFLTFLTLDPLAPLTPPTRIPLLNPYTTILNTIFLVTVLSVIPSCLLLLTINFLYNSPFLFPTSPTLSLIIAIWNFGTDLFLKFLSGRGSFSVAVMTWWKVYSSAVTSLWARMWWYHEYARLLGDMMVIT